MSLLELGENLAMVTTYFVVLEKGASMGDNMYEKEEVEGEGTLVLFRSNKIPILGEELRHNEEGRFQHDSTFLIGQFIKLG